MILVTGGTGLVGSHLLYHLLVKNNDVCAIHQKGSDLLAVEKVFLLYDANGKSLFDKINWLEADINDVPALELAFYDIQQVYHCAAIISFLSKDYQKMRRVNIEGTTNIVNLCISHQIKKLCFVSSVAAIENAAPGILMDESEEWNNASDKSGYAITKYGAEMEVWRASQEGVPVVIVNPGVIIGSGFWHKGSGRMFSSVNSGLKFYTNGITGFVGVQDVVHIMTLLMNSEITNERYVLVAENLSYGQVLHTIADALKKKRPSIRINKFMSQCIWPIEFIRSKLTNSKPLLTKRTATSANANHPYDSKKIQLALAYQFEKMTTTIENTAKDFNLQH